MHVKTQLGFLPGYPLGLEGPTVVWQPMPGVGRKVSAPVRLTAEQLHEAQYGWKTLVRRFPRVARLVVDDFDGWDRSVPWLVEILGQAIRGSRPLPDSLFGANSGIVFPMADRALRLRRKPVLRSLLDALSWATCLSPDTLPQALDWLEARQQAIGHLLNNLPGPRGVRIALALWNLARAEGDRRVDPLLDVLGFPNAFEVPTHDGVEYCEAWIGLLEPAVGLLQSPSSHAVKLHRHSSRPEPTPPNADLASCTAKFIKQVLAEDGPARRRSLELFDRAIPADLPARWQAWWTETTRPATKAGRRILAQIRASGTPQGAVADEGAAVVQGIRAACSAAPPALLRPIPWRHWQACHAKELLDAILFLSRSKHKEVADKLIAWLRRQERESDGELVAARLVFGVAAWLREPAKKVAAVLQLLKNTGLWGRPLVSLIDSWALFEILEGEAEPRLACRALACWLGPLAQTEYLRVPLWVSEVLGDVAEIEAVLKELTSERLGTFDPDRETLQSAVRLAPTPAYVVKLLESLNRAGNDRYRACAAVADAAADLSEAGWKRAAAELVLDGSLATLVSLATPRKLARALKLEPKPMPHPGWTPMPDWGLQYPARLHASIAELDAIVPDAQRLVENLLSAEFPNPDALAREAQAIESLLAARPDSAPLARRLANLHRRIEEPPSVSPVRLDHLDAKLRRTIRHRVLDAWQQDLQAQMGTNLARLLGVAEVPEWLRQPRHQEALTALLDLTPWARDLGLRLLRLRCGPPPWNLWDDPANRQYLERLRAMGIDPEPWLRPEAVRETGRNERSVELSFEEDPLEILQMGAYFSTCLSPWGCNFFSAVVNAADVNKRVVFARDPSGRVVGRCLVAIADSGGLLAFEPYCHDPELGFREIIARHLEQLARRMKTAVVRHGAVARLVASDWYDDGPIDLCSQFPCLAEGSELRQALETIEPAALAAALGTSFAPVPLNALTIPLVLELPEVRARPELVLPLLPRIGRRQGFTLGSLQTAVELAHQAGASHLARRMILTDIVPAVRSFYRQTSEVDGRLLEMINRIDPSTCLRLLRETRPRTIRDDDQEKDPRRRALFADAFAALGRLEKARRFRRDEQE